MEQATRVVNIRSEKCERYIGRERQAAMHFGSPFSHLSKSLAPVQVQTRDASIFSFRDWLLGKAYHSIEPQRRLWVIDHLEELRGYTLGCFCSPLPCHGDIYVALLEGRIKLE